MFSTDDYIGCICESRHGGLKAILKLEGLGIDYNPSHCFKS